MDKIFLWMLRQSNYVWRTPIPTCVLLPLKLTARGPTLVERLNPLGPHDALKHHFTSLKTDLIFLQLRVLERKFP